MVKRSLLISLLCCGLVCAEIIGGFASDYQTYGIGSRAAGMGNAGRSVLTDASAAYWNSALIPELRHLNIFLSSTTLLADTTMSNLSIAFPFGEYSTLAFSTTMTKTSDVEYHLSASEPNVVPDGYFSVGNELYILSYAQKLSDTLNLGLSGKLESRQIGTVKDGVYTADIGLLYKYGVGSLAAVLRNLVVYKDGDTEDDYKLDLDIGANIMIWNLLISMDTTMILTNQFRWYVGAEYPLFQNRNDNTNVLVRAGINQSEVCAGIGTRLDILDLDYAFVKNNIEVQHRFSASIVLGRRPNIWYLYD